MTNQKINDVDTITTISSTDRLLVNTDVANNTLEQIEKDDFVVDIISTDSGNFIEVGTDNKLVLTSSNSANELVKLDPSGKYPALDGSLITGITTAPEIPQTTCSTAAATAAKTATLSGITIEDDLHFYVKFTNANTSATITLNINSEGDWDIYDLKGNQITGDYFSNADDETVLLKADKTNTRFILITAQFWESRMGMPSNVYVDLTIGVSGATYTAPADGWFKFAYRGATATSDVVLINKNNDLTINSRSGMPNGFSQVFIPAKKNDIIEIAYSDSGTPTTSNSLKFIYTEGSKP